MIQVIPLCQSDKRWAKVRLGNGTAKQTIGSDGCTLTAITAFINYVYKTDYTPDQVNKILKDNGGFLGALVIWSVVTKCFPRLKFVWRHKTYNNVKAAFIVYIKRTPLLAEVDYDGLTRTAGRHWVLLLGDRKLFDPIDGKIKPTSSYKMWTGMSEFEVK